MPDEDKQPYRREGTVEAARVLHELSQLPLADHDEVERFVQSVRDGIESHHLKPSKRDQLLRIRWLEVPVDRRPILVRCCMQGDGPTTAEAKSLTRIGLDILFEDPDSSLGIFLAPVAAQWVTLRPPPDAGAEQKKQWDSFSKMVTGEFQRFLEHVSKLKETPPTPEQRGDAEPAVIRFIVDRLADAIIGLQYKAKALVRGKEAHKFKVQASHRDRANRGGTSNRQRYLEAAECLLRVLNSKGTSSDRLLGEIEGRVHERTVAKGRLTIARPPTHSESEELRQELVMVRRELDDLRSRTEITQEKLRDKIRDLSDELESRQNELDGFRNRFSRSETEREELGASLAQRTLELEAARKEHRLAVAEARAHGERVKAEQMGRLLSADLSTIDEIARRADLDDVCRFLISTVHNIRQQLEAAGVPLREAK